MIHDARFTVHGNHEHKVRTSRFELRASQKEDEFNG